MRVERNYDLGANKKFTEQDENTLQYYNQNATKFIENTKSVEFHSVQDKFLSYLSDGSYILDFGCGSGRDSKYFLEKGYRVDAVDGSEEICKITREYVKIEVKTMLFSELSFVNKYEGYGRVLLSYIFRKTNYKMFYIK